MASRQWLSAVALASMLLGAWFVAAPLSSVGQQPTPADDLFGEPIAAENEANPAEDLFGTPEETPAEDDLFAPAPSPAAPAKDEFAEFQSATAPSVEESLNQLKEQLAAIETRIDALINQQSEPARGGLRGGLGMRGGPGELDFEPGMGRGRIVPNPSLTAVPRIHWEYKSDRYSDDKANALGNEGWELVSVNIETAPGRGDRPRFTARAIAVYKRPIEPNSIEPTQQSQNQSAEPTSAQATPTVRTRGTVKFADGQPLPGGMVMFRSLDRSPAVTARGEILRDGTFQLSTFKPGDGAVIGRHEVLVSPPPFLSDRDVVGAVPQIIDQKLSDFSTSNLRFEVTSDSADNNFEITVQRPSR